MLALSITFTLSEIFGPYSWLHNPPPRPTIQQQPFHDVRRCFALHRDFYQSMKSEMAPTKSDQRVQKTKCQLQCPMLRRYLSKPEKLRTKGQTNVFEKQNKKVLEIYY